MKRLLILIWMLLPINAFCQTDYYITSADSTKLYVEEIGSGEPFIFLAGGPGLYPRYLKPLCEEVSKDYRAILLHQRGTGNSIVETVDSSSMSMENYANDLEALRKHLGLEKLSLIGHSWGAMLSMEYASQHPDKVKKLILIGSGGPTPNFFTYFGDNIFMRLHESDLREVALLDSLNKPTLSAIFPGYFFDRKIALKNKASIDFETIHGQDGVNGSTFSNYSLASQDRVEGLKSYSGLVTLIQGRQDPVGVSTLFEIIDLLPQSEAHFIEKCGHFPWLENEQQVKKFYELLYLALETK